MAILSSVLPLLATTLKFLPSTLILALLLWTLYTLTLHPLSHIPGPFLAKLSRLYYTYHASTGRLVSHTHSLHKHYGPLVRIAPNEISSSSATDIPTIYRLSDPLPKTDFYATWAASGISSQPDSFTATDEREHARYRRIVAPVYALGNVLKHEVHVGKCTGLLLEVLAGCADAGEKVDLGAWVQKYAFDVIGEVAFGRMFGFLETRRDVGGWIAAVECLMPVLSVAAIAEAWWRPVIMGSAVCVPRVWRAVRAVEGYQEATVGIAERRVREVKEGVAERVDMLQQFCGIARERGEELGFTDKEVTLEAWVAMAAGADTTATAIRATLYYLMKHPAVLSKAHREIDDHAPTLSTPIRYTESIAQLPYTSACVKEAMRLFPSTGFSLPRHSPPEGLTISGTFIPPGWRVGCNPCIVHYDTTVFGDDASSFRPERWLVSETRSREMEKYLLMFGSGTRTCLGKNIALVELCTVVPEIIRGFEIEMGEGAEWDVEDMWFRKQRGVVVNIKRR